MVDLYINKLKRYNLINSILAGISISITFLIKSPLFLMPFFSLIFDYLYIKTDKKKFILNSIVFIISSYIILIPWIRLNYNLTNKFVPFEYKRADCNIITSVDFVYTIEGDARHMAGLTNEDSVYKYYFNRAIENPVKYLKLISLRLCEVSQFYILFLIFILLGFILKIYNEETKFILYICLYYVLIHSLFSIENRYFVPILPLLFILSISVLVYLLNRIKISSLKNKIYNLENILKTNDSEKREIKFDITYFVFSIFLISSIYTLYLVWKLPNSQKEISNIEFNNTKMKWLLKQKYTYLLNKNKTEEGLSDLSKYCKSNLKEEVCLILYSLNHGIDRNLDLSSLGFFQIKILSANLINKLYTNNFEEQLKSLSKLIDNWFYFTNRIRGDIDKINYEKLTENDISNSPGRYISELFKYIKPSERVMIFERLYNLTEKSKYKQYFSDKLYYHAIIQLQILNDYENAFKLYKKARLIYPQSQIFKDIHWGAAPIEIQNMVLSLK
jgi:hypothetical protein